MSKPIFLVEGDAFLVKEKTESVCQTIEKKIKGETITHSYRLSDSPIDGILVEARTLPFLAEAQIFIISECSKLNKADIKSLESYLTNAPDFSNLVFQATDDEKVDALSKLIKKSGGQVHLCESREAQSVARRFIQEKLKVVNKKINPDALAKLDKEWQDVPVLLDGMVERLILFSGEQPTITAEMVETFEENWVSGDVFQLTNAIAGRRTGVALGRMHEVLNLGEKDTIGLLGLLHWQMRRLWQVKILLDRGEPQDSAFKKCRISPKQSRFFAKDLQSFSRARLENALDKLFKLDWKLKTGRAEGTQALEAWIIEVTS